jgi:protein CpxP
MPALTTTLNFTRTAGALTLVLGLAATAAAQPPGPRGRGDGQFLPTPDGPRGPGGPGGRMMGPLGGLIALHPDLPLPGLDLTDAQREQVRAIMQNHRDEGRALLQRAQAAADGLQKATATSIDEGAAAQHGQALGGTIADAAVLRARIRTEVFAILTPEQQTEANRILADRAERRERFRRTPPSRGSRPQRQPLPR